LKDLGRHRVASQFTKFVRLYSRDTTYIDYCSIRNGKCWVTRR